jgi:hypothetical protein
MSRRTRVSRKTSARASKPRTKRNQPETAIVRVAAPTEKPWELSSPQVVLLKNYLKIADASDMELQGCLEVSRRYKLDPFKQGQIWFVKRWDKSAVAVNGTKGANVYVPQVGIYGMLHIAARDYKDFGSISEAEYGPMFMHDVENHKIKAPEWCRVKAYKKGIEQPTVATIYFEEFCPKKWENAYLFWATMPRAQIEKCAKARVLRTAYPDLGGLYIPEEMGRINEEFNQTPGGRQIIEGTPSYGSHEAAQRVLQQKLAAHAEGKPLEAEIVEPEPPAKPPAPSKKASGKIPESEYHPENVPLATKAEPWKYKGRIEFDYTEDKNMPYVRGDLAELAGFFPKDLTLRRKNDWFVCFAEDVDRIKAVAVEKNFRIEEIVPKQSSSVPPKQRHDDGGKSHSEGRSGVSTPAAPAVVLHATIENFADKMTKKKQPMMTVLLKLEKGKVWGSAFDHKLFPLIGSAKGEDCEIYVKESAGYGPTILGFKRIGTREYDTDGVTPIVQRKDQEAGQKTLY